MIKKFIISIFILAMISTSLLLFDVLPHAVRSFIQIGVLGFPISAALLMWMLYFNSSKTDDIPLDFEALSVSLRALIFVIFLALLIYPAFFLEKSFFSNSLVASIDLLEIEQLNLKSEIRVSESSRDREISEIKTPDANAKLVETKREKIEELTSKIDDATKKIELNGRRISNLENRLISLKEDNHYENLFFVIRSLSLGALGAMLTLLASSSIKSKKVRSYDSLFHDKAYWSLVITNCLAGSIVSIVVFALFYTKQITIYPVEGTDSNVLPDFWRTTLLCLISGAFAERIYEGVATKVDTYIEASNGQPNNSIKSEARGSGS